MYVYDYRVIDPEQLLDQGDDLEETLNALGAQGFRILPDVPVLSELLSEGPRGKASGGYILERKREKTD